MDLGLFITKKGVDIVESGSSIKWKVEELFITVRVR